ncbi:hypothetical protein DFS34DRAFT_593099 [Phlyctochytrium arcticum]|nr:hypothetical protein DFS34DRAFT_593099 [Phlyctochytrium arcticum]
MRTQAAKAAETVNAASIRQKISLAETNTFDKYQETVMRRGPSRRCKESKGIPEPKPKLARSRSAPRGGVWEPREPLPSSTEQARFDEKENPREKPVIIKQDRKTNQNLNVFEDDSEPEDVCEKPVITTPDRKTTRNLNVFEDDSEPEDEQVGPEDVRDSVISEHVDLSNDDWQEEFGFLPPPRKSSTSTIESIMQPSALGDTEACSESIESIPSSFPGDDTLLISLHSAPITSATAGLSTLFSGSAVLVFNDNPDTVSDHSSSNESLDIPVQVADDEVPGTPNALPAYNGPRRLSPELFDKDDPVSLLLEGRDTNVDTTSPRVLISRPILKRTNEPILYDPTFPFMASPYARSYLKGAMKRHVSIPDVTRRAGEGKGEESQPMDGAVAADIGASTHATSSPLQSIPQTEWGSTTNQSNNHRRRGRVARSGIAQRRPSPATPTPSPPAKLQCTRQTTFHASSDEMSNSDESPTRAMLEHRLRDKCPAPPPLPPGATSPALPGTQSSLGTQYVTDVNDENFTITAQQSRASRPVLRRLSQSRSFSHINSGIQQGRPISAMSFYGNR